MSALAIDIGEAHEKISRPHRRNTANMSAKKHKLAPGRKRMVHQNDNNDQTTHPTSGVESPRRPPQED